MERVCREGDGLFPAPTEIKMSCSCPDWAGMCKHVAATLYGAGARLDAAPDLLFTLRGVDRTELIAAAGADLPMTRTGGARERILADDDVAALFGVDMAPAPMAAKAKAGGCEKPSEIGQDSSGGRGGSSAGAKDAKETRGQARLRVLFRPRRPNSAKKASPQKPLALERLRKSRNRRRPPPRRRPRRRRRRSLQWKRRRPARTPKPSAKAAPGRQNGCKPRPGKSRRGAAW